MSFVRNMHVLTLDLFIEGIAVVKPIQGKTAMQAKEIWTVFSR